MHPILGGRTSTCDEDNATQSITTPVQADIKMIAQDWDILKHLVLGSDESPNSDYARYMAHLLDDGLQVLFEISPAYQVRYEISALLSKLAAQERRADRHEARADFADGVIYEHQVAVDELCDRVHIQHRKIDRLEQENAEIRRNELDRMERIENRRFRNSRLWKLAKRSWGKLTDGFRG